MTSSQKWDFFCLFKPVEPAADWLCFVFLLFLSHSHPQMTTSWDCSGRIPHFLTLETDDPIPHKSFTSLLVYWESSMAVMLTLVSFIMPPWTLHRHSTRSQHRLSLGGTCFNWLNEGLFVQCSCPPCSCIPAFTESWRRNQACHEGSALWAFSHNILCHSFVTQISGSCPSPPVPKWWCANCCAAHFPLTKHASRLLFSLQTNSI